jgi:RNA polymerase sigma-70 factor (ECF subfamily)
LQVRQIPPNIFLSADEAATKKMTTHPNDYEDYILLKKALDNDDQAFDKLIAKYQQRLHATAYRVTRNHEQAADAVSDALIRLFRTGGSFRYESKLSTWLHRVVVNCARDIARRAASRPARSLDQLLEGYPDYELHPITPPEEDNTDDSLILFTHSRIMDELTHMPDMERDLLLAVHRDHTTYEHLASDLHVPVGTVKSRLFRARRMLRERLPSLPEIYDDSPDNAFAELTAA